MVCSETKILPGGVWNLDNTSKAQRNQEHNLGLQLRNTRDIRGQKFDESRVWFLSQSFIVVAPCTMAGF